MTPHLAIGRDVRLPLKPLASRRLSSIQDRNLYDLYAVCNHHGSDPHSGHYTGKFKWSFYHFIINLCLQSIIFVLIYSNSFL